MSYQKLLKTVKADLEQYPKYARACELIITKIQKKDAAAWQHLTFSTLNDLSEKTLNPDEVVQVAQYLSGEKIKLFKPGFEYIGIHGQFILDRDNSYYAIQENRIAHPVSGEEINDISDSVFMYFTLSYGVANNE